MSFEAALVVALMVALAATAFIGALVAWRALGRAGNSMQQAEERLSQRALAMPRTAATAREQLAGFRADVESALWTIARLDARVERAETLLADRRGASDRLRVRMMRNRRRLEQVRSGARVLLRAVQMRREFLG